LLVKNLYQTLETLTHGASVRLAHPRRKHAMVQGDADTLPKRRGVVDESMLPWSGISFSPAMPTCRA
jgi:hypothetical protein